MSKEKEASSTNQRLYLNSTGPIDPEKAAHMAGCPLEQFVVQKLNHNRRACDNLKHHKQPQRS